MTNLAFFNMPGHWEMLVILMIGLLLFGKRLPEVGKSLGKGIVEFKKGLKGIEDEIDSASSEPSYHPPAQQRVSRAEPEALHEPGPDHTSESVREKNATES
ncbi:MAG: twin-arginine translocase TatA/TatE family subunit [Phycisphaerales bacterium]|nr:twin-arginine translocase TatA/TatE family subunit [Phycisphaerales bacterium]